MRIGENDPSVAPFHELVSAANERALETKATEPSDELAARDRMETAHPAFRKGSMVTPSRVGSVAPRWRLKTIQS